MIRRFLLEELARRRMERAVGETGLDCLVRRCEGDVFARQLGALERHLRVDVQRGVEQYSALDQFRRGGCELGHEQPSEAVADEDRALDPPFGDGLADVEEVLRDRPGRLPRAVPVTAVGDSEHP